MVKLIGKELQPDETILEALREIPGLKSEFKRKRALRLAKVSPDKLVSDLTEEELQRIDLNLDIPAASVRYIRVAPRKANLVMRLIRGKDVNEALDILKYTPKKAARLIEKVLRNAINNASNNYELDTDNLYIYKGIVNEGITLKRIMPRAMGRATRIRKRTSNIKIVLKERKEAYHGSKN